MPNLERNQIKLRARCWLPVWCLAKHCVVWSIIFCIHQPIFVEGNWVATIDEKRENRHKHSFLWLLFTSTKSKIYSITFKYSLFRSFRSSVWAIKKNSTHSFMENLIQIISTIFFDSIFSKIFMTSNNIIRKIDARAMLASFCHLNCGLDIESTSKHRLGTMTTTFLTYFVFLHC